MWSCSLTASSTRDRPQRPFRNSPFTVKQMIQLLQLLWAPEWWTIENL
jgi:hypothetical protein